MAGLYASHRAIATWQRTAAAAGMPVGNGTSDAKACSVPVAQSHVVSAQQQMPEGKGRSAVVLLGKMSSGKRENPHLRI